MDHALEGKEIAILATDDFEEAELMQTKKALDDAGAKTTVISTHPGSIQAVQHDTKSVTVPVDKTFDEVSPEEFNAVLIPGGALNADALRVEEKAQTFVKQMNDEHKPIAVICHGPWLLVSSDLVKGRTLTSYYTIQDDIRNAGGNWVDEEVVEDKNWLSSRQPSDIPAFNNEMIKLFASNSH